MEGAITISDQDVSFFGEVGEVGSRNDQVQFAVSVKVPGAQSGRCIHSSGNDGSPECTVPFPRQHAYQSIGVRDVACCRYIRFPISIKVANRYLADAIAGKYSVGRARSKRTVAVSKTDENLPRLRRSYPNDVWLAVAVHVSNLNRAQLRPDIGRYRRLERAITVAEQYIEERLVGANQEVSSPISVEIRHRDNTGSLRFAQR